MKMIIMDQVIGKPMSTFKSKSLPSSVFEDVTKATKLLHDKNLVFGDLRAPNIMILNGRKRAMLVDFDWAAKSEEGFYPAFINESLVNIELSGEVRPLGPMHKEHDLWALNKIREKFCQE